MKEVKITTEYIRLDDLLKLIGAVGTGGHAKFVVQNGEVLVDNEVCTMRGKKLRENQTVEYQKETYKIIK